MTRAFSSPMTWVWLMAGSLAMAGFAAFNPIQPAGLSGVLPVALALMLIHSAHGLGRALGVRHGWAAGLALAATVTALPAMSLRPEAYAEAATYQSGDTAWPALRPVGHIALLAPCPDLCAKENRALLNAGAYSIFIPWDVPQTSEGLDPFLTGYVLRDCGVKCQKQSYGDLTMPDLAYWTGDIPTPEARFVTHLTRHVLLRQSEGEWVEIARDTTVHFRTPGLWPGTDTLPGTQTGLTDHARAFDLRP
ncbi:hypothetical protein [Tropicibacter naphthalenivorans]|uniref:Uncharacterized protein n=1 Tax=Tropicibacter naphthalenivorans TaxID=441103 RepID=A0A0N7LYG9_9RHOB|nr:hypothetical protein [Tropicibacter naphthalenivorans]CUH74833.1 hypothetical protein TRN7648_00108 [Tropicibacter naphthalenivorans]SMC48709.1 hypothetical protein SAMN04488093_101770 [Tropicibacter naphthalenivorans]